MRITRLLVFPAVALALSVNAQAPSATPETPNAVPVDVRSGRFDLIAPRASADANPPCKTTHRDLGIALSAQAANPRPGSSGAELLQAFAKTLGASGSETLIVDNAYNVGTYQRRITYRETIRGRYTTGVVSICLEPATNQVMAMNHFAFVPDVNLPSEPALSVESAKQALGRHLAQRYGIDASDVRDSSVPILAYMRKLANGDPVLTWLINGSYRSVHGERHNAMFFVNAIDGTLERMDKIAEPIGAVN